MVGMVNRPSVPEGQTFRIMTPRERHVLMEQLSLLWLAGKTDEVIRIVAQKTGEPIEKVRQMMAEVVKLQRNS